MWHFGNIWFDLTPGFSNAYIWTLNIPYPDLAISSYRSIKDGIITVLESTLALSDHTTFECKLNFPKPNFTVKEFRFRQLKRIDIQGIFACLSSICVWNTSSKSTQWHTYEYGQLKRYIAGYAWGELPIIDHNILIDILKNNFGIIDNALQWFRTYLASRRQRVVIDRCKSFEFMVATGVPQGTFWVLFYFCCTCLAF